MLDYVLRSTPDRGGRQATLRRIYVDFLVDLYWHKNFEPVTSTPLDPATFGAPEELKLPADAERTSVGYEVGSSRSVEYKSYAFGGGPMSIIRSFDIERKLLPDEKGDLEVSIDGPPGADKSDAVLVVFPVKGGKVIKNVIGNLGKPAVIEGWHETDRAYVWVVNTTRQNIGALTLWAKLKPAAKPLGRWMIMDGSGVSEFQPGQKIEVAYFPTQVSALGSAFWSHPVNRRDRPGMIRYTTTDGVKRYVTPAYSTLVPVRGFGEQPVLVEAIDQDTGNVVAAVKIALVNREPPPASQLETIQKEIANRKPHDNPQDRMLLQKAMFEAATDLRAQLKYEESYKALGDMEAVLADYWKSSPQGRKDWLRARFGLAVEVGNMEAALDALRTRGQEFPEDLPEVLQTAAGIFLYFRYDVPKAKERWDKANEELQRQGEPPRPWPENFARLTDKVPAD